MSLLTSGSIAVIACNAAGLDPVDVIGQAIGSMDSIAWNAVRGEGAFEKALVNNPAEMFDWVLNERPSHRAESMCAMFKAILAGEC